ncbi:MAG: peptide deformylase, partial [bacterium]
NQIGERVRAFVIKSNPVIVMFNPSIVSFSEEEDTQEEGCLSIPNLRVKVKRPFSVMIRFTLPNGQTDTREFQ